MEVVARIMSILGLKAGFETLFGVDVQKTENGELYIDMGYNDEGRRSVYILSENTDIERTPVPESLNTGSQNELAENEEDLSSLSDEYWHDRVLGRIVYFSHRDEEELLLQKPDGSEVDLEVDCCVSGNGPNKPHLSLFLWDDSSILEPGETLKLDSSVVELLLRKMTDTEVLDIWSRE